MSRTKLSHLMDAETWMDAHTAINMDFADEILTRPAEIPVENNIAGPMLFSRASVINSLMDKLAAKCHIKKPEIPERSVDSLMKRLDLIKQTMIIPLKHFPSQLIFFISFLCHIVIYAFILLDQLFIANGIHRIPIKTGIIIIRYGDQISFPKIRKVLVLKISVELPTNGIKSNAFCIL